MIRTRSDAPGCGGDRGFRPTTGMRGGAVRRSGAWGSAVAVALALMVLAGCEDETAPLDIYELSGTVTEDRSGSDVGGARITFTSDTLYTTATTTDGDGHYEMLIESDVPFGQVRAEKAGYQTVEETVYFDTRTRRVDLVMRTGTGN